MGEALTDKRAKPKTRTPRVSAEASRRASTRPPEHKPPHYGTGF